MPRVLVPSEIPNQLGQEIGPDPLAPLVELVWLQADRPVGSVPSDDGAAIPPPPGPRLRPRGEGFPPPGFRPGLRRGPILPPSLLERIKNLPPEEQERVLQNNQRFQQLSRERQEQLLDRLHRWQALPSEQKEAIEQRFAVFSRLTPEQRQKAREIYRQQWRVLPPERRKVLIEEFRKLRGMSPAERQRYLSGHEAEPNLNSEDRELLRQLTGL